MIFITKGFVRASIFLILLILFSHICCADVPHVAAPIKVLQQSVNLPDLLHSREELLLQQLTTLLGTPYRYGGLNPNSGLDCSGLVSVVWQSLQLPPLPRSSKEMAREGRPVELDQLKVGDLLFFNSRRQPNSHVGIYIGSEKFIHASSINRKVMENHLSDRHYQRYFSFARRVLPESNHFELPGVI